MKRHKPAAVAAILDISLDTLYRRIRDGSLEAVNVGTPSRPRYRILDSTLEHYESMRLTTRRMQEQPEEDNG